VQVRYDEGSAIHIGPEPCATSLSISVESGVKLNVGAGGTDSQTVRGRSGCRMLSLWPPQYPHHGDGTESTQIHKHINYILIIDGCGLREPSPGSRVGRQARPGTCSSRLPRLRYGPKDNNGHER